MITNLGLGIAEILACFFGIIVLEKLFGKRGLFIWMAAAVIFANIQVSKQVDLPGGISCTLGNVVFASTYLTTDILNEKYGPKASRNAVRIAAAALIAYIIFSQLTRLYIPNAEDVVSPGMELLFSMSLRITAASGLMFLLSNWIDVLLYQKLKEKTGGRYMWLRNNIATIVCNCGENFAFTYLGFLGLEGMDLAYCTEIALTTSALEVIIAVCDTPFLYLAKKLPGRSGIMLEAEEPEEPGAQQAA